MTSDSRKLIEEMLAEQQSEWEKQIRINMLVLYMFDRLLPKEQQEDAIKSVDGFVTELKNAYASGFEHDDIVNALRIGERSNEADR